MRSLFLVLLASAPAFAAQAARPSRVSLLASALRVAGPEALVRSGQPSLMALANLDLAAPGSKLAVMARALPATDHDLLATALSAERVDRNELGWILKQTAENAERYAHLQTQRLEDAVAAGTIAPGDVKRELRLARTLTDSPHMGARANERIAAVRRALEAMAAAPAASDAAFDGSRPAPEPAAPSKISPPLAARLASAGRTELVPVVIEIEADTLPAPQGSREEQFQEHAMRFAVRANAVIEALMSWGAPYTLAWLESAIHVKVPAASVEHLSKLKGVTKLDVPSKGARE